MTLILSALLIAAAAVIIVLLMRVRHFESELVEKSRQHESAVLLLDRIGESLTTRLEVEPVLKVVADYALHAIEAEACAVFLMEDSTPRLRARIVRGVFPLLSDSSSESVTPRQVVDHVKSQTISIGEGVVGQAAATGQIIVVNDCETDSRFSRTTAEAIPVHTMMAAPMIARGSTLGVLAVTNKRSGQIFRSEDTQMLQTLSDLAAMAADLVRLADEVGQRNRLRDELRLAHEFQLMLLPKSCPSIEGIDLAAFCRPALEVGGDFYDFIPLDNGRLGIVIADASGKGIPGALIMATTRSALRSEARLSDSPKDVLIRVNDQIRSATKASAFITMIYGILDPSNRTFTYSRAGHEPLLLCSSAKQDISVLPSDGMALGMVEADLFDVLEEQTVTLMEGQTLIFYTDGVVEAMNESGEEFGHGRFHDILQGSSAASCSERLVNVVNGIGAFVSAMPQHDDITLVAVGVKA